MFTGSCDCSVCSDIRENEETRKVNYKPCSGCKRLIPCTANAGVKVTCSSCKLRKDKQKE